MTRTAALLLQEKPPQFQPSEFGICDECGDYTPHLVFLDDMWICGRCASRYIRLFD